ncbi:uncharacterized protein LOC143280820 [Babylonia areolata]|uniref:uncharacterized protein LOC143280820 n=1 Tax=Babylonia areolata TaxID=304850 RepID=UPI003FCFB6A6
MGTCRTAGYILRAVLWIWIASGIRAKDIVEVEASCGDQGSLFEHGSQTELVEPFHAIHYSCHIGYHLVGNHTQRCGSDGQWDPPQRPQCVATKCEFKPSILNAEVSLVHGRALSASEEGDEGVVTCRKGFLTADSRVSYRIVCNKYGMWTALNGAPFQHCEKVTCPVPPAVPNAMFHFEVCCGMKQPAVEEQVQQVRYTCIKGYEMVDDTVEPVLTCKNGEWEGPIPTCVRPERCSPPMTIYKGKWTLKSRTAIDGHFPVGSEVEYSCMPGYRLVGAEMLKCTADRLWSKIPPICVIQSEKNYFCRNNGLDKLDNGFCKCERSDSNDLEKCEPFFRGTQVRCACDRGYKLMGSSLLTCTTLPVVRSEYGTWDHEPPYCITDDSRDMEAPVPSSRDTLSPKVVNGTRVSTLVIVIATACSVLGVLLLIMVVVVFRRKKPRPRLFHPSVTPPPYSRVHNNILDEHDRLALMAYADATRVHLPTYEEAVHGGGVAAGASTRGTNMVPPMGDYRPLPSIPPNLRTPGSVPGGGSDNPNRHSTVTTSTMNRDGLSENFGSLDTVNVSMSDASTSVTVETFDSGTSNRSMSSQRATAGSIASSEDNLANDNAPLLDNSGETCEDNCSARSTPNLEHKEE